MSTVTTLRSSTGHDIGFGVSNEEGADGDAPADSLGTSVDKAFALLEAFDPVDVSVGVSELARRTRISKSTAHRLLSILEGRRVVERHGAEYRLGTRLFELGHRVSYCRPRSLREGALPFLGDLYELTHQTVHLGVLVGTDVLFLEKLFGHKRVEAPSMVGGRAPAHCTAVGKSLLAWSGPDEVSETIAGGLTPRTPYSIATSALLVEELARVRSAGVSFDREESKLGVNCVAAPIFTRRGRLLGAVSVCGALGRFDAQGFATAVMQAARGIGNAIAA